MDKAKKWAIRVGSILLSVAAILWAVLSSSSSTVPEHDVANAPDFSWSRILHHWLWDIETIPLILGFVGLIVLVLVLAGWWQEKKR
jgi:hypothetical protein